MRKALVAGMVAALLWGAGAYGLPQSASESAEEQEVIEKIQLLYADAALVAQMFGGTSVGLYSRYGGGMGWFGGYGGLGFSPVFGGFGGYGGFPGFGGWRMGWGGFPRFGGGWRPSPWERMPGLTGIPPGERPIPLR